jgi:outer membrane protein assembly factor BamA
MKFIVFTAFLLINLSVHGQVDAVNKTEFPSDTTDVNDIFSKLFGKKNAPPKKNSGIALLPAIGYNPSVGFILGANIAAGRSLGDPSNTRMSTATATAFFTTKNVLNLQLRHNVFTKGNNYNIQGNIQFTKMVVLDYGQGPTSGKNGREGFSFMQYASKNSPAVNPIRYNEIRINEKLYKKISPAILVGAGVAFNYHFDINDENLKLDSGKITPHYAYNIKKGFNPDHYITSGVMLNIQYTTRDHLNRAFKGIYADLTMRLNPTWLGSTRASTQVMTELRKYFSLSKRNPEHVIAFWHLGTYKLGGDLPYLDLPATASDMYNRSGRAYTIGRFRGPSHFYLESEYRFPITRNKLISGVVFTNLQTVSDGQNVNLFNTLVPGTGTGLRILFNKVTRTNICIDYAFGRYGSRGLFFGLNEVF